MDQGNNAANAGQAAGNAGCGGNGNALPRFFEGNIHPVWAQGTAPIDGRSRRNSNVAIPGVHDNNNHETMSIDNVEICEGHTGTLTSNAIDQEPAILTAELTRPCA